jgi:hypothetical protein
VHYHELADSCALIEQTDDDDRHRGDQRNDRMIERSGMINAYVATRTESQTHIGSRPKSRYGAID